MATNWTLENTVMVKNEDFVKKAEAAAPKLYRREEEALTRFRIEGQTLKKEETEGEGYGKGDRIVFDFGHNHAAYFSFTCESVGSPQDAPAFLKIKFCEAEREIYDECTDYQGWISKGWIQEEWLHLDELPKRISMERRYAFRYVVVTVLDTSQKFRITLKDVKREVVSAVKEDCCPPLKTGDELLKKIDEAAVRTLFNCMQTVFEDGPKRDRRLWLGDLRLQALANYETFKEYDLVKRCLYLFAGMTDQNGMIPACVFERPSPHMDDTFLLDYALFFLPALVEYYEYSGDRDTLMELCPAALRQMEIALGFVDKEHVVGREGERTQAGVYHCFTDWNEKLDKQCVMQAVMIYCLKYAIRLCVLTGDKEKEAYYENTRRNLETGAGTFWDEEKKAFVSGPSRQVSLASQVWMILAGVVPKDQAAKLLEETKDSQVAMVTPYMNHFYVTALIAAGRKEQALEHIKKYWGGMIRAGADTFWELYNPENDRETPYGSDSVNSYCHAWSCTPAYLLRVYF